MRKLFNQPVIEGMDQNIKQVIKLPLRCPKCGERNSLTRDDDISNSVFFSCMKCLNAMVLNSDRTIDIWVGFVSYDVQGRILADDVGEWQKLEFKTTFIFR